ncbi:MAG: hypothetical protein ACXADH_12085, partial [Candidatus Kariarchaeaceae archaeon]
DSQLFGSLGEFPLQIRWHYLRSSSLQIQSLSTFSWVRNLFKFKCLLDNEGSNIDISEEISSCHFANTLLQINKKS